MIKKIQGGNTLHIYWTITKNRNTSLDNLSVKLFDVFRKECKISYEIEQFGDRRQMVPNNDDIIIIKIVYEGKNQKSFGKYSLVLFNNYGENNQNTLVFKDAFILLHSLHNKLESWTDEYADNAVLVEIDSDLSVALMNQEIQDKDDILQELSKLTDSISEIQDSIDNISISDEIIDEIENHLDSSLIALNSSIWVLNTSLESLIETLDSSFNVLDTSITVINTSISNIKGQLERLIQDDIVDIYDSIESLDTSVNYIINDIEKSEKTLVEYFTVIDNSVNMLMNSSTQDFDDTELRTMISNTDTSIIDVSTRLKDLSTYTHDLVIPEEYDDTVIKNRIADVSQYTINSSSKLSDLSTYVHNIVIPDSYDDTLVNSSILDISIRLNDLSTYTHNLTPGSADVDLTDVNSSISDLSTRIQIIENSSNFTDWTDTFYYTSYSLLSASSQSFNTSAMLFQDVILNVSSYSSISPDSNYQINLIDTVTGTTSNAIYARTKTVGSMIYYEGKKYNLLPTSNNMVGRHVGDRVYNFSGNWYAFHFPHLMKVVSQNASVPDVSNQVYLKIVNP